MAAKRTIRVGEVVNDIRKGMTNLELMDKFQLSAKGLKSLFTKLIDFEAITEGELDGRVPPGDDTVDIDPRRLLRRNYLFVNLPVCEADNESEDGYVRDITESGLQVSKLAATVGVGKALVLKPEGLADIQPIVLEAQCKWVKTATGEEESLAGFEITDISQEGIRELKYLIHAFTLGT
jgi:hypothetical protein